MTPSYRRALAAALSLLLASCATTGSSRRLGVAPAERAAERTGETRAVDEPAAKRSKTRAKALGWLGGIGGAFLGLAIVLSRIEVECEPHCGREAALFWLVVGGATVGGALIGYHAGGGFDDDSADDGEAATAAAAAEEEVERIVVERTALWLRTRTAVGRPSGGASAVREDLPRRGRTNAGHSDRRLQLASDGPITWSRRSSGQSRPPSCSRTTTVAAAP